MGFLIRVILYLKRFNPLRIPWGLTLVIAGLTMNLSCNPARERSNQIVFSRFPEEISLHSSPLPVDYIMKTGRLEVVDSFLPVVDTWPEDCFIKIFNIHSGKLLRSLCPGGKGPSETEFVSSFSFYPPGRKIFINVFLKNHFLIYLPDSALQDSGSENRSG